MISKADQKRRVTLPGATPGDVYDIQRAADGSYRLIKLLKPEPKKPMARSEVLRRLDEQPLEVAMGWPDLKRLTRE